MNRTVALLHVNTVPGVDMCGRTVMVLVGRNIPVTLIDIEKVSWHLVMSDHLINS